MGRFLSINKRLIAAGFVLSEAIWFSTYVVAQTTSQDRVPETNSISEKFHANHNVIDSIDNLITSKNVSGKIGNSIPLDIIVSNIDGIKIKSIKLLSLPKGMIISDTIHDLQSYDDTGIIDLTSWDLSKICISQTEQRESHFFLAVAAIWAPDAGGPLDVISSQFSVSFGNDIGSVATVGPANKDAGGAVPKQKLPGSEENRSDRHPSIDIDRPIPSVAETPTPNNLSHEITSAIDLGASHKNFVNDRKAPGAGIQAAIPPQPAVPPSSATDAGALVERATRLIRLGDISGARRLLERAQSRNAPNATFLLAQTWDPKMLHTWKVRGLRADPDLAQSLYAKAAEQSRTDERLLAATGH